MPIDLNAVMELLSLYDLRLEPGDYCSLAIVGSGNLEFGTSHHGLIESFRDIDVAVAWLKKVLDMP